MIMQSYNQRADLMHDNIMATYMCCDVLITIKLEKRLIEWLCILQYNVVCN